MSNEKNILSMSNVRVRFGGARILRGVDIDVSKGDVVCLIGANGAGKTTLLRTIAGLERASSGRIATLDHDITNTRPKEILSLGLSLVPEAGKIFTDMTVMENLLMGAYLRSDSKDIAVDIERWFEYFPVLRSRKAQTAGSLSGGERQMLAVSRALMSRPKLLMMDEPSSGLAPIMVKMLGNMVSDLNRTGISVLLVEQNAEMALNVSDYGYVLERGRIVLEGPTKDLLRNDKVKAAYLGLLE
jgi:branched-chain amino acid transport system ATP-binding protein